MVRSRPYQLDVPSHGAHESLEVAAVQCDDVVSVSREVGRPQTSITSDQLVLGEQLTRGAPERPVERTDIDALAAHVRSCAGGAHLATPGPPRRRGSRELVGDLGRLEACPHRPFVAFEGD